MFRIAAVSKCESNWQQTCTIAEITGEKLQ